MRRMLFAWSVALAGATSVGAAGAAEPPRAALEGFGCQQAFSAPDRSVSVTAVMRPVAGTTRMALKFRLLRKTAGGGSWAEVGGGDLSKWKSPGDPTLGQRPDDVWRRIKEVMNLPAPAIYRFQVAFRWTGNNGQVLSSITLLSRTCDES